MARAVLDALGHPDVPVPDRLDVRPLPGLIREWRLRPAPDEVAAILRVPLTELRAPGVFSWVPHPRRAGDYTPAFTWRGEVIWGATARTVVELLGMEGETLPLSPALSPTRGERESEPLPRALGEGQGEREPSCSTAP